MIPTVLLLVAARIATFDGVLVRGGDVPEPLLARCELVKVVGATVGPRPAPTWEAGAAKLAAKAKKKGVNVVDITRIRQEATTTWKRQRFEGRALWCPDEIVKALSEAEGGR